MRKKFSSWVIDTGYNQAANFRIFVEIFSLFFSFVTLVISIQTLFFQASLSNNVILCLVAINPISYVVITNKVIGTMSARSEN